MKKVKIIYWTTTILIFLFEGVMPALTSQTQMAKDGITHLGYPNYFGVALTVFKVCGALLLIIPQVPKRVKEWVYAGFAFDFIFACISIWAVDGLVRIEIFPIKLFPVAFFPLIFLAILAVSYIYREKLESFPVSTN